MIAFAIKHVLYLALLVIGVTLLTFILLSLAPGDFLSEMSLNPQISSETIQGLREKYGLDKPWYVQYVKWLSNILRGDFGYSFSYQRPAFSLIWEMAGNTLILALISFCVALSLAIPLGMLAAVYHNRWVDRLLSAMIAMILSFPTLFLALLLLFFAAKTGWFPIGGIRSVNYEDLSALEKAKDYIHHLALPILALCLRVMAMYVRQIRATLLDVLSEPFITTAYAKGLKRGRIFFRHALPNAFNPILSISGLMLANLLSGAFIVEVVMSWPGLGRLTVTALLSRDIYLIMAALITASTLLLLGNFLADISLMILDPRISGVGGRGSEAR